MRVYLISSRRALLTTRVFPHTHSVVLFWFTRTMIGRLVCHSCRAIQGASFPPPAIQCHCYLTDTFEATGLICRSVKSNCQNHVRSSPAPSSDCFLQLRGRVALMRSCMDVPDGLSTFATVCQAVFFLCFFFRFNLPALARYFAGYGRQLYILRATRIAQ